jgi:hypothetical protein
MFYSLLVSNHVDNPHLYIGALCGLNILGHTLKGLPLKIEIVTPLILCPHLGAKGLKTPLKPFLFDCHIGG